MINNILSEEEFLPFAPETPGFVWVHHCKQGPRKNKLIVTRNENGTVIAFCHHCNASGFHGVHGNRAATHTDHANSDVRLFSVQGKGGLRSTPFSIPADCEGLPGQWGTEALAWARKYLTDEQIADSPLTYSPKQEAIIFPMINMDHPHTLVGYQLRKFPETEPKYLTNKNNSIGVDIPLDPFYTVRSGTCVLTEDWVSAYKAGLAGYEGVPLMGSNLRESQFLHLLRNKYQRYVIALDNDNPLIRRQQRALDTRLSSYAPTLLLRLPNDLKEYTLDEIKDLIDGL